MLSTQPGLQRQPGVPDVFDQLKKLKNVQDLKILEFWEIEVFSSRKSASHHMFF